MEVVVIRRVMLVVNPQSRGGSRLTPQAEGALAALGIACDVRRTTCREDATALAADAIRAPGSYDAIFTLGGDGTVMGVLQAVAQTGLPVGVLPGGTGNLLARALRVPLSVPKAVAALCRGYSRDVDVARLGDGRLFAFAAGVGIDATMVMETSVAAKRRFGVAAYVGAATRATLALDRFTLHATVDGVSHRLTATIALVANFGAVLHGALQLGPSILENDGMLDLCVFSPASVRDALRLGWRIARRDFATDPAMHFFRGRHIHLETEPPRGVQADGDYLGVGTLDATVLPGAARLLVPSSPAQVVTS